ncbi:unnamed protein product, partial [Gulo gulo]
TRQAAACQHPREPEQPRGKAQAGFTRPAVETGASLIAPRSRCEVLKNPSKFTSVAGAPHSDLEGLLPDGQSGHHRTGSACRGSGAPAAGERPWDSEGEDKDKEEPRRYGLGRHKRSDTEG